MLGGIPTPTSRSRASARPGRASQPNPAGCAPPSVACPSSHDPQPACHARVAATTTEAAALDAGVRRAGNRCLACAHRHVRGTAPRHRQGRRERDQVAGVTEAPDGGELPAGALGGCSVFGAAALTLFPTLLNCDAADAA